MGVKSLRDATLEMVEAANLDEITLKRCRHVVTENDRCQLFKVALSANDHSAIGQLMRESHESLRDDYEVSCMELDSMAEAAWSAPGCVGARMTGAGFGGACVALVVKDLVNEFNAVTLSSYDEVTDLSGETTICEAADGARRTL
jgi:galactokinase